MFLRKLIAPSLIISASIGSSIAVGTHNELLSINTDEIEQGTCIALMPNTPEHLIVFTDLKTYTKEKIAAEERRAQKAQRNAQRQALHKVIKSFKAPIKSLHQPR
ncbi:MAG: hypothetical protein Q8Q56_01605 [Alphaproteobacteria bacterium]|nr:hypothetical protein [Alphaproteobacteria bacterium]